MSCMDIQTPIYPGIKWRPIKSRDQVNQGFTVHVIFPIKIVSKMVIFAVTLSQSPNDSSSDTIFNVRHICVICCRKIVSKLKIFFIVFSQPANESEFDSLVAFGKFLTHQISKNTKTICCPVLTLRSITVVFSSSNRSCLLIYETESAYLCPLVIAIFWASFFTSL